MKQILGKIAGELRGPSQKYTVFLAMRDRSPRPIHSQ